MKINWASLTKAYFLPTAVIIIALALLAPAMIPYFGPAFGTFATYVVQASVIIISLWFSRKVQKAIDR